LTTALKSHSKAATVYSEHAGAFLTSGPIIPMGETREPDDFEQTIFPHLNAAYNLARWLLRNNQDAEDVVHESYLRAHRYFGSFQGGDGRAWLMGIVRNTCMTWLRQRKSSEPFSVAQDLNRPNTIERDPEQALLLKENLGSLRTCIEALPAEYRETLILRELEGFSYHQIAEATGAAPGTVMSRLSRARKRLTDCLTKTVGEMAR